VAGVVVELRGLEDDEPLRKDGSSRSLVVVRRSGVALHAFDRPLGVGHPFAFAPRHGEPQKSCV
jgi:hypothetical protein